MSTDRTARAAAEDLWARTTADVDEGLSALVVAHARHRPRSRAVLAGAVAAAVLAGWWGGDRFGSHDTTPAPAPTTPVTPGIACQRPLVDCLGARTFRFALASPVRWHIPRGFGVDSGGGATTLMTESYWRHHGNPAGVTVLEDVSAPAAHFEAARPQGRPATASGFVHWLAARPSLLASAPRRTTVGGRPAWQVRVSLRRHASPLEGRCTGSIYGTPCYPVTYQDVRTTTGIWGDMVADYTAVRLPGSGTAVVWSWAFGRDTVALSRNQELVAGLSWPDG